MITSRLYSRFARNTGHYYHIITFKNDNTLLELLVSRSNTTFINLFLFSDIYADFLKSYTLPCLYFQGVGGQMVGGMLFYSNFLDQGGWFLRHSL